MNIIRPMIATDIISCTASVATVIIAVVALYTWKREFIGKKKIELAAEIMETVYEIQDAFIYARCPAIARPEIDEALRWIKAEKEKHPENTDVYPNRITYLIPHRRLEEKQDIINKFRTLQNKAYMYWGKDMYVAFVKLTDFNQRIMRASKNLYYGEDTPEYKPLYDLIFCEMKDGQIISDDKVNKEINEIVEEFRRNLEPLYTGKRSKWIS